MRIKELDWMADMKCREQINTDFFRSYPYRNSNKRPQCRFMMRLQSVTSSRNWNLETHSAVVCSYHGLKLILLDEVWISSTAWRNWVTFTESFPDYFSNFEMDFSILYSPFINSITYLDLFRNLFSLSPDWGTTFFLNIIYDWAESGLYQRRWREDTATSLAAFFE